MNSGQLVFATWVRSAWQRECIRVLVESIRTYGGPLSSSEGWVFEIDPENVPCGDLAGTGVEIIPIEVPDDLNTFYYGDKVYAAAQAEELADSEYSSLLFIAAENLIIQPPDLFYLSDSVDAAVRPVHIKNVGLSVADPVDLFWAGVYRAVGVEHVRGIVESFIEGDSIWAYYNSAAFSVDPSCGLLRRWLEYFRELVLDGEFQAQACQDDLHKVFLHQAVLSTLIDKMIPAGRLRILPAEYIYPYNLHADAPLAKRARSLNELVSIYYEGRSLAPGEIVDIDVQEPLRSWMERTCE